MKNCIRKKILALRKGFPKDLLESRSSQIVQRVLCHPSYRNAECVLCYIDAKGEVQTKELIEHAWAHGKCIAVPRVHGDVMKFYFISSYEQLEPGSFGIMEPKMDCPELTSIPERSLVIMPGVAFDLSGNRIGYGKGYYDKYFAAYENIYKIGLAFSFQIAPEISSDVFDIKANCIITDSIFSEIN